MLGLTKIDTRGRRVLCAIIVFFAVTAVAVSVATRYCSPQASSYAVKTLHKHSSPEQSRQRLNSSATNWMPQVLQAGILPAPPSYPRIPDLGPSLPSVLLEPSLYNRPPPSC